jgi:glycine C-acetyltransferase
LDTKELCPLFALVTRNDIIVYDVDAHACIIDGVFTQWKRYTYKHNDLESMGKMQRATKMATETGGILFITEGFLVCADNRVNLKK